MRVPVRITPEAQADVRQGRRYFNGRRARLGLEFAHEVLATIRRIGDMPLGYGEVGEGIRAAGLHRFGYVVYYRSDGTEAEVLAVIHSSQPPEVWQARV